MARRLAQSAKERAAAKAKAREVGLARNFKRKKPKQEEVEDCEKEEQVEEAVEEVIEEAEVEITVEEDKEEKAIDVSKIDAEQ